MKKTKQQKVDKKILTFFLIAFPTLLIIALAMLTNAWWAQILLALYQFILLKQFLDNYYEVLD